jgi:hypothetical protein
VVYDSDEVAEYEETLHKGRTLFRLIEGEHHTAGVAGETGPSLPSAGPTAHATGFCLDT